LRPCRTIVCGDAASVCGATNINFDEMAGYFEYLGLTVVNANMYYMGCTVSGRACWPRNRREIPARSLQGTVASFLSAVLNRKCRSFSFFFFFPRQTTSMIENFPGLYGGVCTAFCEVGNEVQDKDICAIPESDTTSTVIWERRGCPCKRVLFQIPRTPAPTLHPAISFPTPAPSTPFPTVTHVVRLLDSAVWAGTGDEGLFLLVDGLGLTPGDVRVNMTADVDGHRFLPGEAMLFGEFDQSRLHVSVADEDAIEGQLFTLLMLDVDLLTPGTAADAKGSYVHAAWCNLRGGDSVDTGPRADVVAWEEPAPQFGSHRYALLLLEQVGGVAEAGALRSSMGYGATTTADGVTNRARFDAAAFAANNGLVLVGGTFFYMPCTRDSAAASAGGLNLTECTQLCSGGCSTLFPADGSVNALTACPCDDNPATTLAGLGTALPPPPATQEANVTAEQWAGVGPSGVYAALDYMHLQGGTAYTSDLDVDLTVSLTGVPSLAAGSVLSFNHDDQDSLTATVGPSDDAAGKYFSVLLLDPQLPNSGDAWMGTNVHGWWANLQNGESATTAGANVVAKLKSAPPFGSHRYVVLLLEQSAGVLDVGNVIASLNGGTVTTTPMTTLLLPGQDLGGLLVAQGLKLANANMFYLGCNTQVMATVYQPTYGYGDGATCMAYCSFTGGECRTDVPAGDTNLFGIPGCPCAHAVFPFRPTPTPTQPPSLAPLPAPTGSPSVPPTGQPSAPPTLVPTSPTNTPSLNPSPRPTFTPFPSGAPSLRPTAAPTLPPTSSPPTPAPTPRPTPKPTTRQPTPRPTRPPTRSPSMRPTPQPTHRPTPLPTSADEVLVSMRLTLNVANQNDVRASNIFPGVASALTTVDEEDLVNFVKTTRRRLGPSDRLLPSVQQCTFDVRKSLAETSYGSPEAFANAVSVELSTQLGNGQLSSALVSSCGGCTMTCTAATAELVVRTLSPAPAPSAGDDGTRGGRSDDDGGVLVAVAASVGSLAVLFLLGASGYYYYVTVHKQKQFAAAFSDNPLKSERHSTEADLEKAMMDAMMGGAGASASPFLEKEGAANDSDSDDDDMELAALAERFKDDGDGDGMASRPARKKGADDKLDAKPTARAPVAVKKQAPVVASSRDAESDALDAMVSKPDDGSLLKMLSGGDGVDDDDDDDEKEAAAPAVALESEEEAEDPVSDDDAAVEAVEAVEAGGLDGEALKFAVETAIGTQDRALLNKCVRQISAFKEDESMAETLAEVSELKDALDAVFGKLKDARRGGELEPLKTAIKEVKESGFAPFDKDALAKAEKLAALLTKRKDKANQLRI